MVNGEGKPIGSTGRCSPTQGAEDRGGLRRSRGCRTGRARRIAAGKDKILIGVPSSLSTPYGVADDTDHLNGTNYGRRGNQLPPVACLGVSSSFSCRTSTSSIPKAAGRPSRPASTRRCSRSPTPSCSPRFRRWTNPPSTNAPICRATPSAMRRSPTRRIRRNTATCCRPTLRRSTTVGLTRFG